MTTIVVIQTVQLSGCLYTSHDRLITDYHRLLPRHVILSLPRFHPSRRVDARLNSRGGYSEAPPGLAKLKCFLWALIVRVGSFPVFAVPLLSVGLWCLCQPWPMGCLQPVPPAAGGGTQHYYYSPGGYTGPDGNSCHSPTPALVAGPASHPPDQAQPVTHYDCHDKSVAPGLEAYCRSTWSLNHLTFLNVRPSSACR